MSETKEFYIIGLMSGSSRDGLDLAYCRFSKQSDWNYELLAVETLALGEWEEKLNLQKTEWDAELEILHAEFGKFLGDQVNRFIKNHAIERIDAISSHGHTIFHYPEKGLTCQIGEGQLISNICQVPVLNNLRQKDVDAGGQGAPIVPIGDLLLYPEYPYCLNIGGIANISIKHDDEIVAFDICTANQILNHYAVSLGAKYDDKGEWAKLGRVNQNLLLELNSLSYYQQNYPKSLDNGFSKRIISIIESFNLSPKDILATYVEHIAIQIGAVVKQHEQVLNKDALSNKMLVTGGGAFNTFLINRIGAHTDVKVVIPSRELIDYKEAIVMGFMAALKLNKEINVLASVTGASKNTSSGDWYFPSSDE